jgi:hypothetical protein
VIRVRKEWTRKQALTAQKRFEEAGGRRFDPQRPLAQWEAMHELDQLEQRFLAGDRYALAEALRVCASRNLPMPPWVAGAYIKGYDAVNSLDADSWDVLFGPLVPKGKHIEKLRKRAKHSGAVYHEVQRRHHAGEAIDDELLTDIGKRLGISASTAWEWYRAEKRYYDSVFRPGTPIAETLRPYRQRPKK